jgi:hypothetical protein
MIIDAGLESPPGGAINETVQTVLSVATKWKFSSAFPDGRFDPVGT